MAEEAPPCVEGFGDAFEPDFRVEKSEKPRERLVVLGNGGPDIARDGRRRASSVLRSCRLCDRRDDALHLDERILGVPVVDVHGVNGLHGGTGPWPRTLTLVKQNRRGKSLPSRAMAAGGAARTPRRRTQSPLR